ncbi:ankyrin repeat domain-containing protein [Thauera phenolivorans]|uniref:ankyrin repeat domain-containing protein n=1 Tax=Thauera phenolivorans TaxID=1792543 RepID=UPI00083A3C8C|nr:ankyrin repeat domain-containing protein [Thauera phenolivorans]
MKHSFFAFMGASYPIHLERSFERILLKIEALWDTPEIHDYFSDLLIDRRGGRKGFPAEVVADIIQLRDTHELESFRRAELAEYALAEIARRGVAFLPENFVRALERGDKELVDLFVRANFNVNMPLEDGSSPLLFALKRGLTIIAQILLGANADPNAKDRLGLTPLLVACGKATVGYGNAVAMLLKKGAAVNVRDPLGNTPLMLAISGESPDIAMLLLEHGADVRPLRRNGEGALSLAERLGHADLVRCIRDKLAAAVQR